MEKEIKKKGKLKQKTGKEIINIYETLKKDGVTPETAIFYLMIHMDKMKASEIGMDMSDANGNKRSVIVAIHGDEPAPKPTRCITPMVM